MQGRKRIKAKYIRKDYTATKIINDLKAECPHKCCMWFGKLDDVESHIKSCEYHPDKVKNQYPEWILKANSLSSNAAPSSSSVHAVNQEAQAEAAPVNHIFNIDDLTFQTFMLLYKRSTFLLPHCANCYLGICFTSAVVPQET